MTHPVDAMISLPVLDSVSPSSVDVDYLVCNHRLGRVNSILRWTPNVRQPEPRLKVSPYRFRCRARSQ